jgi:hypothetical protein
MLFFYIGGFIVLVSAGILVVALPCFRSASTLEVNPDSTPGVPANGDGRATPQPSFSLPKPPPLKVDTAHRLDFSAQRSR